MKKFLLAFGIILALAFSVTAATTNFNATTTSHATSVDGDCDKCGKKDCKGDCTEKKACCSKKESKKACTGKKECKKGEKAACHKKTEGEKKSCSHH